MRVVLDTNVLISALLFGGHLQFIVDFLEEGRITPCFSSATWKELKRTLQYPHLARVLADQDAHIDDVLFRLSVQSIFVADTLSPIPISGDRADEAILACAAVSSVTVVVTGDKLLLSLHEGFSIPIMSPQQFKKFVK